MLKIIITIVLYMTKFCAMVQIMHNLIVDKRDIIFFINKYMKMSRNSL